MYQSLHGKLCISRRLNTYLMENGIEPGNKDVLYDSTKVRHYPKFNYQT
jgi:hypothetical protein